MKEMFKDWDTISFLTFGGAVGCTLKMVLSDLDFIPITEFEYIITLMGFTVILLCFWINTSENRILRKIKEMKE